jgi:hypothetical protein
MKLPGKKTKLLGDKMKLLGDEMNLHGDKWSSSKLKLLGEENQASRWQDEASDHKMKLQHNKIMQQ